MASDHDRASGVHAFSAEIEGADALSDVLELIRLTGAVFFCVDAAPPWSAEAPCSPDLTPAILPRAQHVVSYHVLIEGVCWCRMDGEPPVRLESGDVIVVPHGDAYGLASGADLDSDRPVTPDAELLLAQALARLDHTRALESRQLALRRTGAATGASHQRVDVEMAIGLRAQEAEQAQGMPTREFHIVGGLHPKVRLS